MKGWYEALKKKKIIVAIAIVAVVVVAAVLMIPNMLGGSVGTDNEPEVEVSGESNVLVAYFSWSGNSQQMANWVAEETGGEIFRIVPAESYGTDFGVCADRAQNELNNEIRPEIFTHIDAEIMADYDVIYLGFPIWWYDLPTPVWTFLEEYDLSGKTIIPFFSHNGSSGGANSLIRVSELAVRATVLSDNAISIQGDDVLDSEQEVKNWAKEQLP